MSCGLRNVGSNPDPTPYLPYDLRRSLNLSGFNFLKERIRKYVLFLCRKTYFPCYLIFFYIDMFSINRSSICRFQFFPVLSTQTQDRISNFLLVTRKEGGVNFQE